MIRSIAIASMTLMIVSLVPMNSEAASRRAKIGAAVAGGLVAGVITTVVVDKAVRSSRERNARAQQAPVVQPVVTHAPQQQPLFDAAAPAAPRHEQVFAQQAPQPMPQQSASVADARAIETRTMQLVNEHRASLGLAPFAYDADVALLAREHSQNMGSGQVPFGHANFASRVARAGRGTSAAENVAYSTRVDQAANDALASWLKSPGHRANLEGNRRVTGIGAAVGSDGKIYLTQLFFRG